MKRPKNRRSSVRKYEAEVRQRQRESRTTYDQLRLLDTRPGESFRERLRLSGVK